MKRLLRVEHPVLGGKVERERPVLRAARKKQRLHQTDQTAGRPFLLAKHAIDPLHKGLLCLVLRPAKRSGVQRVKNLVIHTAHPLSRFSYSIIFLYRLASKTGRAALRRARSVCFGNFTAEFVGGDAHIAPREPTNSPGISVKSDLRAGSMCSIDPYANSGHFTHTNIRKIPEDFVRTRVPENQRVKKRWSMAAASALVAPLCGWR